MNITEDKLLMAKEWAEKLNKLSKTAQINTTPVIDLSMLPNTSSNGRGQLWWDKWFLGLAEYVSTASKDPSTRVGSVIVDKNRVVVSCGYNGFPRNTDDSEVKYNDRDIKLATVCHAEINAILFAKRDLTGCCIYISCFCPCANCASFIIQSGITRVVAPKINDSFKERWGKNVELSKENFKAAGVQLVEL